jgi:hypothetical protein
MKSLSDLLKSKKFQEVKNVSQEYQSYGVWLSEKLNDTGHKSLYIKLAKEVPRQVLAKAYSFAIDYPEVKSKARIFMWKIKEQGGFKTTLPKIKAKHKK